MGLFNTVPKVHNMTIVPTIWRGFAEYNRAQMTYANWPTRIGGPSLMALHTLDVAAGGNCVLAGMKFGPIVRPPLFLSTLGSSRYHHCGLSTTPH